MNDLECRNCNQSMTIEDGMDLTDYCHDCAQKILVEALELLAEVESFLSPITWDSHATEITAANLLERIRRIGVS